MIEEALGLLYPNTAQSDIKKIAQFRNQKYARKNLCSIIYPDGWKPQPQKIRLKIYTPLTPSLLPNKLPAIYQPFTIPMNDLSEECLKVLYGDVDIQKVWQLYEQRIMSKSLSLPKAKKIFFEMANSQIQYRWVEGMGGLKTIAYSENAAYQTLRHLQTRLNYFDTYGILSNEKNPYCLKKTLRKDIKDLNTISVLDLHWLRGNRMLQFFCLLYFLKSIENTIDEIGVVPFKIATVIDEAREIMARSGEGKSGYHIGLQDYINELLTAGRKRNEEIWLSSQTPSNLKKATFKNMRIKLVTHLDDPIDIAWLCSNFTDCKNYEVQGLLERMAWLREYKNDYRFITIGEADKGLEALDNQLAGRNINDANDVANSLPHPRANQYYRIEKSMGRPTTVFRPSIHNDFETIIKQLKAEGYAEPTIDLKPIKKALISEWKQELEQIKKEIKEKKDKKQAQKRKQEQKEQEELEKIAEARKKLVEVKEKEDNWTKLSALTGYSRDKIRRLWEKSSEFM